MPQIPLSRPGALDHVRSSTPLTGGGQNIKYYGNDGTAEAIAKAAEKIGRSAVGFSQSMQEFLLKSQDAENKLAAAEDRAFFRQSSNELLKRITENPAASIKEKQEWIREFQENYDNGRKVYLDRMTKDYRALHDVEMSGLAADFAEKRNLALIASDVQNQADNALKNYQDFCERGEFEEAERLVKDMHGTIWSDEQAKNLLEKDLPMRRDFSEVTGVAESMPLLAMQQLQEVDAEGKHIYYKNLSEKSRRQMIRYAQGIADDREKAMDENVMAEYAAGNKLYTDEQLSEMREVGTISDRQFTLYKNWNHRFDQAAAARETMKEKAAAARRQQQIYKFKYDRLYSRDWTAESLTPEEARAIYKDAKTLFGEDYDGFMKFADDLKKFVAKAEKKENFYSLPIGKQIKSHLDGLLKGGKLYYDPDGLFNIKDDEAFQSARYLELYGFAEQLYNSGVTDYEPLYGRLEQEVKKLNDGKIDRIVFNAMDGTSAGGSASKPLKPDTIGKKTFNSRKDQVTVIEPGVWWGRTKRPMMPDEIKARKEAGEIDEAELDQEEAKDN